jgi:hypothetical protein
MSSEQMPDPPVPSSPPAIIPAALFLDANGTVSEALRRIAPRPSDLGLASEDNARLRPYDDDTVVAIRRQYGTAIYWYRRRIRELRYDLQRAHGESSLVDALNLHETDGLKPVQLPDLKAPGSPISGVVLSGQAFIGFLAPEEVLPSAPVGRSAVRHEWIDTDTDEHRGDGDAADYDDDLGVGFENGGGGGEVGRGEEYTPPRRDRSETSAHRGISRKEPQIVGEEELDVFSAYPRIEAPDRVLPEQLFQLLVGLSKAPAARVEGNIVTTKLPRGTQEFAFDIQVTADGFRSDEGWSRSLNVKVSSVDDSYVIFTLRAPKIAEGKRDPLLAMLLVHFTRAGVECGTAWRRLIVAPAGFQEPSHEGAETLWVSTQPDPVALTTPPPDFPAPDLTVRITKSDGNQASGNFSLTFATPHPVALPSEPLELSLGQDAPSFARALISWIDKVEGSPLLRTKAPGVAKAVSLKLRQPFWDVVDAVAQAVAKRDAGKAGATPMTLFLLSAEASVPWELAWMPKPLNPNLPSYLGAQVAIGRWILGDSGPPLPQKSKVNIASIAAVSAYYSKKSRVAQLPGAIKEANDMHTVWGAVEIDATPQSLADLLTGEYVVNGAPADFQAIHFACHGQVFPLDPPRNAVLLQDGSELNAIDFLNAAIGQKSSPFLFMNACQVGTQVVMLGENFGFAGCSLHAGFSAFIGPLWSVNDELARMVSHEFYQRAFNKGETLAEILRDIRTRFDGKSGPAGPTATPLAYVLYGNPALRLAFQQ